MATLYDLSETYMQLLNLLEQDKIDADAFRDTLDSLDGDLEDKADGYGKVYRQLRADAKAAKAESDRLRDRSRALEINAKTLMARLQSTMELIDKPRLKTALFNFTIQNNPPFVDVVEESELPIDYLKHVDEWHPDRTKIKEAIKAGKEVPGAILKTTQSLRVR